LSSSSTICRFGGKLQPCFGAICIPFIPIFSFTLLLRFYGEVRSKSNVANFANVATRMLLQDQNDDERKEESDRLILFTHYTFLISVNGPKVIEISWEGGDDKNIDITDIDENLSIGFTYTVKWKDVQTEYVDRAQK
jgi:hypothetical protein